MSFPILMTQWTVAPRSMGFPRQEYWSGVVISFPKGSSQARDRTHVSALQADTLPPKPPGKPPIKVAAAAAKLLQSCPTLCNPIDGSPPGSLVPGILQARVLEWVAIAFSPYKG